MVISLAAARVNKGLTQAETATALGIAKGTYMNYETGKTSPSVDMAGKIADLFEVPLASIRFSK